MTSDTQQSSGRASDTQQSSGRATHYDMIAIGAGSGGLSAVERASEYGKNAWSLK